MLAAVQLALFLATIGMRPDIGSAMTHSIFWWKATSMILLSVIGCATAVRSFDPQKSPARGLRLMAACTIVVIAFGWLIDDGQGGTGGMMARLDFAHGSRCMLNIVVLSVPPAVVLGLMMRRGATTHLRATAAAIGLASATWGASIFVFDCPQDDPLYIAVWHAAGVLLVTVAAVLVLPRFARW